MARLWVIGVMAAMAFSVSSAYAFQETNELPPPPGASSAADDAAPAASSDLPPPSDLSVDELQLAVPDAPKSDGKGTVITLPGVGTIGTLPKLDFGLELLYGNEPAAADAPEDEDLEGDLRIRGSVKHKF
ncbi:MAG: hypothetical protein AAFQ42_04185 [Pseudomonadota bacterium]